MYLEKFLTEYDEGVSSELNLDPLGLQVIWSAYGQKIFKNRISSISNDVRNYTLNLFHHYIVRAVVGAIGPQVILKRAIKMRVHVATCFPCLRSAYMASARAFNARALSLNARVTHGPQKRMT